MSVQAGHLALCVCCGDEFPEDKGQFDFTLNGPVCLPCSFRLGVAQGLLLRHANCSRGMLPKDITASNHKRFLPPE